MARFVDVESVEEFINKQKNSNTTNKTIQDVNLLLEFLRRKNETQGIHEINPSKLNEYISEFLVCVRRKDGKEYEPTTLRAMFSSIERYLREWSYPKSLINDVVFSTARNALKSKQKELKSQGKGNAPNAAEALTKEDISILYHKKLLGPFSPESLINSLWLNNMLYFGLRGCQAHRLLQWGDVTLKVTTSGTEYLVYDKERQTKTRTGAEPTDTRAIKPKMFALPSNPDNATETTLKTGVGSNYIDPVELYKFYAAKRPKKMDSPSSPFYLTTKCERRIE